MAADPGRDNDDTVIYRREIWMNQETVITKRVTWYILINGQGNNSELVETYKRLYEVANTKNKGLMHQRLN